MEDLVKSEIGVSVRLVTEQVNVSLDILALQMCTIKNKEWLWRAAFDKWLKQVI